MAHYKFPLLLLLLLLYLKNAAKWSALNLQASIQLHHHFNILILHDHQVPGM